MKFFQLMGLSLVFLLCGCGVTAPSHNAGYADLDGLSWRDVDATVSFSLGPRVLGFAARMIEDDPQTKAIVRNLDGVRVRVYEIEGDPGDVAGDLNFMSAQLREAGWEPVILVREEGETTHVLIKMDEDRIAGLTVLTSDALEVVLVNVMGELRPELFAKTMVTLDLPAPDLDV